MAAEVTGFHLNMSKLKMSRSSIDLKTDDSQWSSAHRSATRLPPHTRQPLLTAAGAEDEDMIAASEAK